MFQIPKCPYPTSHSFWGDNHLTWQLYCQKTINSEGPIYTHPMGNTLSTHRTARLYALYTICCLTPLWQARLEKANLKHPSALQQGSGVVVVVVVVGVVVVAVVVVVVVGVVVAVVAVVVVVVVVGGRLIPPVPPALSPVLPLPLPFPSPFPSAFRPVTLSDGTHSRGWVPLPLALVGLPPPPNKRISLAFWNHQLPHLRCRCRLQLCCPCFGLQSGHRVVETRRICWGLVGARNTGMA